MDEVTESATKTPLLEGLSPDPTVAVVAVRVDPEAFIKQHNALINASFNLITLEMRLFVSLLARIQPEDESFQYHFVHTKELIPERSGGAIYQEVRRMVDSIGAQMLKIERLVEDGGKLKRRKNPNYEVIPLMARVYYDTQAGGVIACFNPLIVPYLLRLKANGNFTSARLNQVRKIKNPYGHRIYWWCMEWVNFGRNERTIELDKLKFMLGMTKGEYEGRFNNFNSKVLLKAQQACAETDLPFSYRVNRERGIPVSITFHFQLVTSAPEDKTATKTPSENELAPSWETALLQAGIGKASLPIIRAQLAAQEYDEGYLHYVLRITEKQQALGKIKKSAKDYLYKGIIEKHMLEDYLHQALPAIPAKISPPPMVQNRPRVVFQYWEVEGFYQDEQKMKRTAETFLEFLERKYLAKGFSIVQEGGKQFVVREAQ
ncbi:replication initiation protein [Hymenobacter sp.]|jgi:plasmid replication initiation protein|uniref:replication initiation protein n=1 Tax=Hymenobacter sp. TaxID=1898978 RepID=UPI002EDBB130